MESDEQKLKKNFFKKEEPIPLNEDTAILSRKLRILEERHHHFRNRIQVIDQNMILNNKRQAIEMKAIRSDLSDLKKKIDDINEKIELLIKGLKESAKKEDIDFLQKYINLWEPMNFITRKEVERLIEEAKTDKT